MTVRPLFVTTGVAEPVKVTPGSTTGVPTIRTKARPVGSESTTTADGVVPRGKSTVSSNVASSPITPWVLELNESTIDVLGTLRRPRPDTIVVGFAAETHDVAARARDKLARKGLDLIVANDVTLAGAGFDVDTNVVTLIDAAGTEALPLLDKEEVAEAILDRVVKLRAAGFSRA